MAIAFVQKTAVRTKAGNNDSVALAGVTAGNWLVLGAVASSAGGVFAVSDDLNGSWTSSIQQQVTAAGSHMTVLFYKENVAAGTTTITYDPPDGSDMAWQVAEFSGLLTAASPDGSPVSQNNGSPNTAPDTGNLTTGNANDLLIAIEGHGPSGTITENQSGTTGTFTLLGENESGTSAQPFSWAYQIVAATGTYKHVWLSPSTAWAAGIAAFKASAGAAATTPEIMAAAGHRLPDFARRAGRLREYPYHAFVSVGIEGLAWAATYPSVIHTTYEPTPSGEQP